MKKIVIVDYGLSNLCSVTNAFEYLGVNAFISRQVQDVMTADTLVLPGVGAFHDGMKKLYEAEMVDLIKEKAEWGTPLLGICLGMQLLFEESEEYGVHKGLGLISGRVVRIPSENIYGGKQRIPHVSWEPLFPKEGGDFKDGILDLIKPGEECYFIHSYEAKPFSDDTCIAETEYGGRRICSVVQSGSIIGMQFHPEKSGEVGLRILKRFAELYC